MRGNAPYETKKILASGKGFRPLRKTGKEASRNTFERVALVDGMKSRIQVVTEVYYKRTLLDNLGKNALSLYREQTDCGYFGSGTSCNAPTDPKVVMAISHSCTRYAGFVQNNIQLCRFHRRCREKINARFAWSIDAA